MTTLQKLCDEELIKTTKCLVSEERKKTLEVIEYLQVIYDRRLHLKRGFSSLHAFLVKELFYSDGAAHRRISAMRLVQDMPEVKEKLATGALSLTTASTIQSFFRSEKQNQQKIYSKSEKRELISKVEGSTKQECVSNLAKISPAYAASNQNEMKIPHDEELVQLIEEYRKLALLSNGTTPCVLKSALKTAIANLKCKRQAEKITDTGKNNSRLVSPTKKVVFTKTKHSRYIPLAIKQAVWKKNQGQCSYLDLKTKLRCGTRHRLHLDHILPFALGGRSTASNLRLLCQAHNTMLAIETFGELKVETSYCN